MNLFIFMFIFTFTFHVAETSFAANQCYRAQSQRPVVRLDLLSWIVMKIVRSVVSDPTALRMELKGVVDKNEGMQQIQFLADYFGSSFSRRDTPAEGEVNITSTLYLNIAKYLSPSGLEKSVKLRFRRYFSQKGIDKFRKFMNPAKGFEEQSMMEIKVQHPYKKNVVVKLRVKVWNNDIPAITGDQFFMFKDKIRQRMLSLNKKRPEDVELGIDFLTELYSNPARSKHDLFAHTEYERDSYSMKIAHISGEPSKSIEVQITSDINVWLKRVIDGEDFSVYGDDQVIFELKVPNDQAALSEKDILEYPGLAKIKEFKEWLEKHHDNEKEFNRGKVSKISTKKFWLDDGRKKAKEEIVEFLRKIGWVK